MKFYLSSYKIGNEGEKLRAMAPKGKIGYIPNALDFLGADQERRKKHVERDMNELRALELAVECLDLREYFGKKKELKDELRELGAVFISGGNTFVLRQAMKLSGLDELLREIKECGDDFLYAGYSAGGCVLSPSLRVYTIVDDSTQTPYKESKEVIWKGSDLLISPSCRTGSLTTPSLPMLRRKSRAANRIIFPTRQFMMGK